MTDKGAAVTAMVDTVQQVETRANQLRAQFDPVRVLLILLSLPFILLGWVARFVYRALVVVGVWMWAAAETGWKRAAPASRRT